MIPSSRDPSQFNLSNNLSIRLRVRGSKWLLATALIAFMMIQVPIRAQDTSTTNSTTDTASASTSADTSSSDSSPTASTTSTAPVEIDPEAYSQNSTSGFKIKIDSIEPMGGPTSGETRVLVRGGPYFGDYQTIYPKPQCKFGHDDMVVDATYVLCTASVYNILEKEARHRDKNATCLQCDNSPASAKAEIVAFTVSLTGDFSDVGNSVVFRYYPPTRIYAIYPRYGPKDGDTVVQVWGENFLNHYNDTRCAFGTKSVVATYINSNYMICISPQSDVVEKPIPFTISLNNQQNSKDDVSYWYYSWPAITDLTPDRGPDQGGTHVLLKGRNFHPFKDLTIDNANDTFCMFENLAKVPATVINSTKVYCTSPPSYVLRQSIVEITLNNQQYTDDNNIFYYYRPPYLFDVRPREGPVSGGTRVIAVGSNFRNSTNITCKFNETVVSGKYLSTSEIECYSPPTDHPGFVPLAVSLELDMYSPAVQYLYYEQPVIDDIEPKCGPDYGYTQITVHGKNFLDMGHNKAICVFNKTIFTNATIMDENTMKCDSPSLLNSQGYSMMTTKMLWYYVEISIDGGHEIAGPAKNFTYYKDPKQFDVVPDSGPIKGGTRVRLVGSGFSQEGACNKTARFAVFEVKPFNKSSTGDSTDTTDSSSTSTSSGTSTAAAASSSSFTWTVTNDSNANDTQMYVRAPKVKIPDQVVVGIALNGQQFTKDIIIHNRDQENTFEYYNEPIISSFTPKAGPNIGGTLMKINGLGFTPKKDSSGNTDKKKNKMWVRFVDSETGEQLATPYEVSKDDLSDDEIKWYTPNLPSDTKALMQISLNNQDWQSIPLPNKTYTYSYYESPHIIRLNQTFGPVKSKHDVYIDIEGTGFKCPDANCSDLFVRFGEGDQSIFEKGKWLNESYIRVKVPKYTKPDVLRVEITMNGEDYTNDGKTYGYFDPYVLNAEPRLISVEGTTKVRIKGFGFVNSSQTKSMITPAQNNYNLLCNSGSCIRDATYIDKYTLETATYPQSQVNYDETQQNILWDGMNIDAAVYGNTANDFTDSNVEIYYYEEPDYKELSADESPANVENQIFIKTDFKKYPIDRLRKFSNFTCRFKAEDGRVMYTKGEMEHYPLANGTPNAVQCKSPKWNLTSGKNQEVVKLDIAVNGFDFKGSFDFTFSMALKIHRVVPMAGPAQGNSKTRLIGTGFKPPKNSTNAKWGIVSTDIIQRSLVEDYIYYKTSFENMIEGYEGIKAYWYEAYQFEKVDTIMEEGFTYHSAYLNTPQIGNWTKTHGGPYYVEVGKNIEVLYQIRENVTYYKNVTVKVAYTSSSASNSTDTSATETSTGDNTTANSNTTVNSTSSTATADNSTTSSETTTAIATVSYKTQTVQEVSKIQEEDVIKSWIYYEYDPSSVEYYYYKDCVIKDMQPHSGLVIGGTPVSVVGAWFKYMPEYGVVPHCKFGDKIVRGIFDSTVRIVCHAPPNSELGIQYPFEVSMNGVDWSDSGYKFTYYEVPNLSSLEPTSGPEAGGTMIYIFGSNFTNMSNPNEFNCRFSPTTLQIPPKKMPGIFLNSSAIMCASPGGWGQGEAVKVQVTFNGGDYDNNNFTFTFFSVTRAFPRSGPSDGSGGDIIIEGFGFRNDTNPLCKLNGTIYEPISVSWRQIRCPMPRAQGGDKYFGNVALAVAANGHDWHTFVGGFQYYPQPIVDDISPKQGPNVGIGIINFYGEGFRDDYNLVDLACKVGDSIGKAVYISNNHIKCVVEDMELVNEGEYLPAQLALNKYSWTNTTNLTFFLPYGIEQIYPSSGPTTGVTDVIVQGRGFSDLEGGTARCRFGTPANYAIVDAQVLSYERIACKAPVDFAVVSPEAFPIDLPFSIAFTNDDFDPWTETSHKFRLYQQPTLIKCDPCEVEVGTISEVLIWADETSEFFQPMPVNKPSEGEQQGLINLGSSIGGVTCQFGRFGETQAIYINETVIKCITPAVEDDPDSIHRETVKVTVALNGVDHDESTSQVDFTFVGTGTYMVFWPFIIGALLIGLLVMALVMCCATLIEKFSLKERLQGKNPVGASGLPNVFNLGGGVMVPRGRADWNAERSSVDNLERASGQQFY